MVSVKEKSITYRIAVAEARIYVGEEVFKKVQANEVKKGDVLSVAKLAGISAAKKTFDLIPLCHNIPLDVVRIDHQFLPEAFEISFTATVEAHWKTGVEMEALTAVSLAALTVYDMCKALSQTMRIRETRLLSKSGGTRPDFVAADL